MKTALAFSTLPFLLAACFAASPAAATDRDTDLLREVDSHKAGRPPRSIIGRANTCATQPIVCGQTVTGALASGDCALSDGTYVDFWTFPGQNGQAVTIDLSSNDFDSYLFLLDPTPTVRAHDDDSGSGLNARITYTLDQNGTWSIAVNSLTPDTGNYTLRLACSGTPPPTGSCVPSATAMCLNNNRFRVEATYQTPQGQSGSAQVVKLTEDTGYLWFFSASNVEVVVKILNACGLGGKYWAFAGGLTNVHTVITVTDTQSGRVKSYTNPQSTAFQPIQDTGAFATCP